MSADVGGAEKFLELVPAVDVVVVLEDGEKKRFAETARAQEKEVFAPQVFNLFNVLGFIYKVICLILNNGAVIRNAVGYFFHSSSPWFEWLRCSFRQALADCVRHAAAGLAPIPPP